MKLSLFHLTSMLTLALVHAATRMRSRPCQHAEEEELGRLYDHALDEGGAVVLWAAGDTSAAMDWYCRAFEQRFPGLRLQVHVDRSRGHCAHIEHILAGNGRGPDLILLQSAAAFERWKAQGALLEYRPLGAQRQKPGYADPEGAWITAWDSALVPLFRSDVPTAEQPQSYAAFLIPSLRGRLVLTWPHDDDVVLYLLDRLQRAYGIDYLRRLAAMDPYFVHGTSVPAALLEHSTRFIGSLTGQAVDPGGAVPAARRWLPQRAPLAACNQRMAIFKAARHPFGARLALAWTASFGFQSSLATWRARSDVGEPPGLPPLDSLHGADVTGFNRWVADDDHVRALRSQMRALFGPHAGTSLRPGDEAAGRVAARGLARPEPCC